MTFYVKKKNWLQMDKWTAVINLDQSAINFFSCQAFLVLIPQPVRPRWRYDSVIIALWGTIASCAAIPHNCSISALIEDLELICVTQNPTKVGYCSSLHVFHRSKWQPQNWILVFRVSLSHWRGTSGLVFATKCLGRCLFQPPHPPATWPCMPLTQLRT